MKTKMIKLLGLALLSVQLVSCGNMNNSVDNLEILNSTNLPTLNSFAASGLTKDNFGPSFSSATPYWVFTTGGAGYGSYFAPARGIVTEIGVSSISSGSSYVTIVHSARLATRVHGLQLINNRPGDSVLAGASVGTFFSGSIAFQVLLDGSPVCPLSFLSESFRKSFAIGSYNPCL
jgi:hypothetical protein